ncbi:MAG: hypothetical protein K2J83_03110 [Clostridia bacterium]|nr:hypothetical protein [Clostridia bacterium]
MKKIIKGALCAGLALTMCAAVGCKKQNLDPETRQLSLAVGALDGNFNPFTYTAANDGEMISMTQLSLLNIDNAGKIVYGENEVCAALDMKVTMYDANHVVTESGDNNGTTEYEITLKKGIMFSDGVHELTIKDVLFNLYVYLDPAYVGSTTIYSTNIQGLAAYRSQDPDADDNSSSSIDQIYHLTDAADDRIYDIVQWSNHDISSTTQIEEDVALAKKLFNEEIESDWTAIYGSWEESYKAYNFTEAWQAFLFSEGIITVQERLNANGVMAPIFNDINGNNKIDVDDGEKYYTTLDPWQQGAADDIAVSGGLRGAQDIIDEISAATSDSNIDEYIAENEGATRENAILALQRDYCVNMVVGNYTTQDGIGGVVSGWATATTLYEAILGQLRTAKIAELKKNNDGKLLVPNISGIKASKNSNGNDVLKITINGVDPKAQFNFAFPIAPLYYYSGTFQGKNYVTTADPANDEFGLEFGNSDFFDDVISAVEKTSIPVGAGPYRATNRNGGDPTRATFYETLATCYFKRNDYFETVGTNIQNAKIKFVNYNVYNDSKIMEALQSGEIDFGKPNATRANVNLVSQLNSLSSVDYETGGYGYIGVNPKAVPEHQARQAIMKAINTGLAIDFYGSRLAQPIYRPMSKTSWAYPEGATEYPSIAYDNTSDGAEIKSLMAEAGYELRNGVYQKGNTVMKLTFTIAGDSTEHPAYNMFNEAASRLNTLGFQITVTNDANALKSLISGDLDVWAAAWTSSTDPDMYQIYHKESNATSVNNWNYKNILKNPSEWQYEYDIIQELSDKIDEGRSYLHESDRIPVYADCLDLIMDLAVELPTYQRHDLCVYNHNVIDSKTLVSKPNNYIGLFDKLWEINYV